MSLKSLKSNRISGSVKSPSGKKGFKLKTANKLNLNEEPVNYKDLKLVTNADGKLLDHEGKPLELRYPMSQEDRRLIIKELKEAFQPLASKIAAYHCEKMVAPIKHDMIALELKL